MVFIPLKDIMFTYQSIVLHIAVKPTVGKDKTYTFQLVQDKTSGENIISRLIALINELALINQSAHPIYTMEVVVTGYTLEEMQRIQISYDFNVSKSIATLVKVKEEYQSILNEVTKKEAIIIDTDKQSRREALSDAKLSDDFNKPLMDI